MVKKLLKHEFIYYARTFVYIIPVLLISGILIRILACFESDNLTFIISFSSFCAILYFTSFVAIIYSSILGLVRFYKNLYSNEGYLTFVLPVSSEKHIFAKMVSYLLCNAVSVISILIAWLIAFLGVDEIWHAIGEAFKFIFSNGNVFNGILIIFEILIASLVASVYNILLTYACISIGQLAKKNRIAFAILAGYVYYIIIEIIALVISLIFTNGAINGSFDGLVDLINKNPYPSIHIITWITILITGGLGCLFFHITRKIMNEKLNLE